MTARAPAGAVVSLVDAVDLLLNRGALLSGEATLSLAGVDLVYVGLNLLIASVETMRQLGLAPGFGAGQPLRPTGAPPRVREGQEPPRRAAPLPDRPAALMDPADHTRAGAERPEQGLARLVLALVELLRQVLERQAVRRMEGGSLPDADVERMGLALRELEQTMTAVRKAFGLSAEDLNLDLGPLGRLLGDAP
ncbi:MAG TPA: gas vesicle protein GvpJ [Dehalococcoidia bacterium]|nr:gas vesicle protein GvpJ [Dehalococcoidia bacterium]